MATKDISRTIIEGGRANWSKNERRASNGKHRAQNHQFVHLVKTLVDSDEAKVAPVRASVRKEFDDKLSAAYRWMRAQCGKPWTKVFSNLTTRFDARTTAGRHIIYDHLLSDVCTSLTHAKRDSYFDFLVDEQGLLQLSSRNRWSKKKGRYGGPWPTAGKVFIWAQGRRVMDYGSSLFWMVPKKKEWMECDGYKFYTDRCHNHHRAGKKLVLVDPRTVLAFEKAKLPQQKNDDGTISYFREKATRECLRGIGEFKQDKRLSAADVTMWNSLHENDRERLVWVLSPEMRRKNKIRPGSTRKRL